MADENKKIDGHDAREAAKEMFFSQTVSLEKYLKSNIILMRNEGYSKEEINICFEDYDPIWQPHELEFIKELVNEVVK